MNNTGSHFRHGFIGVVHAGGPAEGYKIKQTGSKSNSWWGLEHAAIFLHAAWLAAAENQPCMLIEAGAHQGTLAILGAKVGCNVYSFEGDSGHVLNMKSNLQENDVEGLVSVVPGFIDREPTEQRIDTILRRGGVRNVTLLKMDIDGRDALAMQGASSLFEAQAIRFINFEFSPAKQRLAGVDGDQYLHQLHRWGFQLFLFSCVPNKAAQARIRDVLTSNGSCLTYGNYGRVIRNPYIETEGAKRFARCFFGLRTDGSSRHQLAVHDDGCQVLLNQQLVRPTDFAAFASAVHEVDLVGKLIPW
jgi:hypothetical protein